MVLAIPYFKSGDEQPTCVAYMPYEKITKKADGEYRSAPAKLGADGIPVPRREYVSFFDISGLRQLEQVS